MSSSGPDESYIACVGFRLQSGKQDRVQLRVVVGKTPESFKVLL